MTYIIEDNDFGIVNVFYYPEAKAIVADGLCIKDVPESYTKQDIIDAWTIFRNHYWEYGAMWIPYELIAQGENLFN
ncbi:MAG: hypothetical protein PUI54_07275 [Bacteroidales bacterium]|nr:hypothetical protein [Bacteroidales bacterium]MDY2935331.1 hypothetical protein [Candidatus Cryptobacteroides sp.]